MSNAIASAAGSAIAVRLMGGTDTPSMIAAGLVGFWVGGQLYDLLVTPTALTTVTQSDESDQVLEFTVTDD